MKSQPLNAKSLRRLGRNTGLRIKFARAYASGLLELVTFDHMHYLVLPNRAGFYYVEGALITHTTMCPGNLHDDCMWSQVDRMVLSPVYVGSLVEGDIVSHQGRRRYVHHVRHGYALHTVTFADGLQHSYFKERKLLTYVDPSELEEDDEE